MLLGTVSVVALLGIDDKFTSRGIYLVVFALLVGVGACWLGITALRQSRRGETWRPRGAIFGIVFGAIGALLSMMLLILFTLIWPQLTRFSQCLDSANTLSAQHACTTQLNNSVKSQLPKLGSGG
ncbi:MAG TPA: hypothetical protein VH637_17955 [Streptosporangiaceae bacterium]|jgi:hypothetical protein